MPEPQFYYLAFYQDQDEDQPRMISESIDINAKQCTQKAYRYLITAYHKSYNEVEQAIQNSEIELRYLTLNIYQANQIRQYLEQN